MNYSDEIPSILNIAEGGAVELFDLEIAKVFKNLSDHNRAPDAEREITLTVKFKPTDAKNLIDTKISVKTKLAPRRTLSTLIHVENGEGRELISRQRNLDFNVNKVDLVGGYPVKQEENNDDN
jgi:hypothetical protein